jgi:hypothetical protein
METLRASVLREQLHMETLRASVLREQLHMETLRASVWREQLHMETLRAPVLREQLQNPRRGTCWRPLRRFLVACLRDAAPATPAIPTPDPRPPPHLRRRRFPLTASPLPHLATSTDRPGSSRCRVLP